MSKQDDDRAENGGSADLATERAASDGNAAQTEPQVFADSAAQPAADTGQSEQSRQFNSWLDRTLPRLMQYLAGGTTVAVTSLSDKAKH